MQTSRTRFGLVGLGLRMRWSRGSAGGNTGANERTARGEGERRKTWKGQPQTERKHGATLVVPLATEQDTSPPKPKPQARRPRPPVGRPTSLCTVTLPLEEEFARHKGLGLGLGIAAKFGRLHLPHPTGPIPLPRRRTESPSTTHPARVVLLPWQARRGLIKSKAGETSPTMKTGGRGRRASPSARTDWLLRVLSSVSSKQTV